jgi:hypothetical protein
MPVCRFISVPTSVVVPRSKANAVALPAGVAGLDGDELVCGQHRGDPEVGLAEQVRQRSQRRQAGPHVVALGGERVAEPGHVRALVLEGRLGQLDEDLAHAGVEQHQPAQTHGGGLRGPEQLRHDADGVLVHASLAG